MNTLSNLIAKLTNRNSHPCTPQRVIRTTGWFGEPLSRYWGETWGCSPLAAPALNRETAERRSRRMVRAQGRAA